MDDKVTMPPLGEEGYFDPCPKCGRDSHDKHKCPHCDWDRRLPEIGGYDPELDEDDGEDWDERKPEIGGYDPELDYDG